MERLCLKSEEIKNYGMIYPLPRMDQSKKDHIHYLEDGLLAKLFTSQTGAYVSSKVKTVISLMEEQKEASLDRINYPMGIVEIDDIEKGYLMSAVRGKTLNAILNDPKIPFEMKKRYLKEIGLLLEDMKKVRENTRFTSFYMNDIHEKNFICKDDGTIKAIDVDSFRINDNTVSPSMYLRPSIRLTPYSKYSIKEMGFKGKEIVPSYDSEIYCYSMIILNYLLGEKIIYMHDDEFNKYLDYLESLGMNKELTSIFRRLYSEKENVNPVELIDELIEDPYTRRRYYQKTKRK